MSRSSRIAFVVRRYPHGGAEKQAKVWADELLTAGHQPEIISVETSESGMQDGLSVRGLNLNSRSSIPFFGMVLHQWELARALRFDYDMAVSFVQYYHLGWMLNRHIPTALSIRMFYPNILHHVRRWLIRRFDVVFTNNLPQASLLDAIGQTVLLINNSVETATMTNISGAVRRNWLVVSNVKRRKNLETVIHAFKSLESEGYTLDIAGRIEEPAYLEELKRMTNGREHIRFTGYLNSDQLNQLYADAAGLILPSFREGSANVILESMSRCLPVIASRTPENISLLENIDEFLFDVDNSIELARKVKSVQKFKDGGTSEFANHLSFLNQKIRLAYTDKGPSLAARRIIEIIERKKHGK